MQDWVNILLALVKDDRSYEFGTKTEKDMKVATPCASIEVQPDSRWEELVRLGEIFGMNSHEN